MINKNEEYFAYLEFVNPKKKHLFKTFKFFIVFSSLCGASIGISLDLENIIY